MFEPLPESLERLPAEPAERRLADSRLAERAADLTDELRRSLGWTLLLFDRLPEVMEFARGIPSFSYAAVGFLHPEVDEALAHSDLVPFGVVLYAEAGDHAQRFRGELVTRLEFAETDVRLPVVARYGVFELHATAPTLPNGRIACWATSRGGLINGWLTAGHVADDPAFQTVGTVLDRGPLAIDAAVVDIGQYAQQAAPVTAYTTLCAGLPIDMDLSSPQSGTVLDVAGTFGIMRSPRFPIRFATNIHGVPGDSGSLVTETQWAGDPLGLYLGEFTPSNPPANYPMTAGFAQSIAQLEAIMDLEVFR